MLLGEKAQVLATSRSKVTPRDSACGQQQAEGCRPAGQAQVWKSRGRETGQAQCLRFKNPGPGLWRKNAKDTCLAQTRVWAEKSA